jgi:fibro-slime domain-containing protein
MKHALRKSRGFFNRGLALVLATVLMLSVVTISGVSLTVSAASGSSYFSQGDYIYVSTVDVPSANFGTIKCHMYSGFDDSTYIDSIDMQQISDNYYRCFMLADNVKYLKFKLSNGNDWWITNYADNYDNSHFSVNSDDQTNNSCSSKTNNCLYIKSTDAKSASWGSINSNDPDNTLTTGTSYVKTATNGSTMKASNLQLVKGTFYDYYNNDEVRNGWISGLDGSERSYLDREPFTFFNNKIAEYARSNTSWSYPLYFGDFNRSNEPWGNGYTGAGVSNLYNYKARANNSQMTTSGTNGAVSGLVDTTLSGGATGNLTAGGVVLPYFDSSSSSILRNGYGAIVNSQFAFRTETRSNDTYYVYDSTDGKDNFYFTNLTGSTPVANYYNNSNKIRDALSGFSSESNGYGFFPFDEPNTEAKDFGFGMKLEIPFTLNQSGKTENGNDVVFNFSGDDDLWVFIDGELVLDMGGAHKKATGSINFTTKTVSVSSLDTTYGYTTSNNIQSIEYGTSHTMTVFYMERGMVESNLKIEYNFTPLDNLLTTEKVVDTTNVNAGVKDAVKSLDEFTVTNFDTTQNTALANKEYSITDNSSKLTSASDGSYAIKDSQKSEFVNIVSSDQTTSGAKVGDTLSVSESSDNTKLSYTTKYTVTDIANNTIVGTANADGNTASFKFINSSTNNTDDYAAYNVKFTNTPVVGDLSVSKTAVQHDGTVLEDADKTFSFKAQLDLSGGTSYSTYNLVYDVLDSSGKTVSSGLTATNGAFTLKSGQTAVFKNIPVNTTYQVTESSDSQFTTAVTNSEGKSGTSTITGSITNSANTVSYKNTEVDKTGANVQLGATKLLDAATPDVNTFEFTLTELEKNGSSFTDKNVIDTVNNNGSEVKFGTISYDYVAPTTSATEATTKATTAPTTQATTAAPTTTQPTTAAQSNTKRIYVKNTADSSTAPRLYVWYSNNGSDVKPLGSWPGTQLSQKSGDWWYADITLPSGVTTYNAIVNKSDNDGVKTKDLTGLSGDTYITITSSSNYWDNTTYETGKTTTTTSASTQSLAKASADPSEKGSSSVGAASSTQLEYHYYKIAETALSNTAYSYDSTLYYAVVAVNTSVSPNAIYSVNYYASVSDAINGTNSLGDSSDNVVFNNYHLGKVTVNKQDQSGEDLSGTQFALVKVSEEGLLDDQSIYSSVVGDIDKASDNTDLQARFVSGTTDEDGNVVFDNIVIYQDGSGMYTKDGWSATAGNTDEFTAQTYCLFEYSPTKGYNPSYAKYYFTLPREGKYDVTFDYVDGAIVMPDASGSGMKIWTIVGLCTITAAALLFAGYAVFNNQKRRKRRAYAPTHKH